MAEAYRVQISIKVFLFVLEKTGRDQRFGATTWNTQRGAATGLVDEMHSREDKQESWQHLRG